LVYTHVSPLFKSNVIIQIQPANMLMKTIKLDTIKTITMFYFVGCNNWNVSTSKDEVVTVPNHHAMEAYRGSGCQAPYILNLSSRWRQMVTCHM